MKQIKFGVLLVISVLFITACGCTKKFTVDFDSNGGTKVESQTVEKGGKVTKPDDPTRENYEFDAWLLDNEVYDFETEVTKDITLKAKWTKVKSDDKKEEVCTLTCAEGYAVSATCECYKLTVNEVVVENYNISLDLGTESSIKASVKPAGVLNKNVTYSSSNESIVKVDENGKLTAVSTGVATITVTSSDSGVSTKVTVEVLDVYEYSVKDLTDGSNYSKMVVLYKNGKLLTSDELSKVNAIYTSDLVYFGRYESKYNAIIVDKDQVNLISKIKVDGKTYSIKEKKLI